MKESNPRPHRKNIRHRLLGCFLASLPRKFRKALGVHLGAPDVRFSLIHLRELGFMPKQVLDVGAYEGKWTQICQEVFPDARFLCIEPGVAPQEKLKKLAKERSQVQILQVLLGRSIRDDVPFEDRKFGGSSVFLSAGAEERRPMTTIDRLVEDHFCNPPDLLKLDVQGYEIEVLEGFTRYFDQCQVIQCEISLLPLIPGGPLLHELVTYLHQRGFVMFDVEEIIRAPSDGAVWQIDALFCRKDSSLRTDRVWDPPGLNSNNPIHEA